MTPSGTPTRRLGSSSFEQWGDIVMEDGECPIVPASLPFHATLFGGNTIFVAPWLLMLLWFAASSTNTSLSNDTSAIIYTVHKQQQLVQKTLQQLRSFLFQANNKLRRQRIWISHYKVEQELKMTTMTKVEHQTILTKKQTQQSHSER